jgi:hypothetical protein
MDFTRLIEDVIARSKPARPNCKVCGGQMSVSEWGSDGKELLVCNKIKPTNMRGDARVYDPQHYEASKTRVSIGVDLDVLRRNLAEAFGKAEAEAEKRLREEFQRAHTAQVEGQKPVEAPKAAEPPKAPEAPKEKPAKKKADVPVQNV